MYVAISVTILIPSLIFFCFVCVFSLPYPLISVVKSAKNICIYIHLNGAEVGGFSKHGM